jgi:hypothetical protein
MVGASFFAPFRYAPDRLLSTTMEQHPRLVPLMVALLLATACSKDKDDDGTTGTGPTAVLDPTVITPTDANGIAIGAADSTDWRTNDMFPAWELAFFSGNTLGAMQPVSAANYVRFGANPVQSGLANLKIASLSELRRVKLAYVDRFGQLLAAPQYATPGPGANLVLDLLTPGGLLDGEHYRMYYQGLTADSLVVMQGHGDFQMNN